MNVLNDLPITTMQFSNIPLTSNTPPCLSAANPRSPPQR